MTASETPGSTHTSFAKDIRPLFRESDRESMKRAFDLWDYNDVTSHSSAITARLADGSMPCDGPWPAENVELFTRWVNEGTAP